MHIASVVATVHWKYHAVCTEYVLQRALVQLLSNSHPQPALIAPKHMIASYSTTLTSSTNPLILLIAVITDFFLLL